MTKPLARIAITIPAGDLADADRLARRKDRSRSWVVAEAVRRYVHSESSDEATASADPPARQSTNTAAPVRSGLGPSRLEQLRRDMALTPEARIRAAEETLRLTMLRQKGRPSQLLMFDRFEDYLEWKRLDLV